MGAPRTRIVRPDPRPAGARGYKGRRVLALALIVLAGAGAATYASVGRRSTPPRIQGNTTEQEQPQPTVPDKVVKGEQDGKVVTAAWVKAENARPGSTGWKLTNAAHDGEISGFADNTSVQSGQPVTLYVSTRAPTFHIDAYRMGFYQGTGGRLVSSSIETEGVTQPRASVTPGTNMVEAAWQPSIRLATSGWPEGNYLLKLVASTGQDHYVPLTVRNDTSSAAYVIVNAVTTWQAYNQWGGFSLYTGSNGNLADVVHRSRVVSFDRPYQFGDGAGDFLGLEYPFVSLAESLGLDVTYLTDVDLNSHGPGLLQHRAVFSLGHDEYYSRAMRDGLQGARDHGVNLAFLGANAIYRHIRFDSSPLGADRRIIDYKSAREDPFSGMNNADVTVNWRDPPNNDPESQLIGNFYQCNPVQADMVVVDPANWLFAGSHAVAGQRLPKVVGSEYDRYDPTVPGPANVEILTHSPVVCHGKADFADATYYSAASGAGVFASGTINFVGHMDANCDSAGCAGKVLGRVITNLLVAFGAGPAGLAHPSDPGQSGVQVRPPASSNPPPAETPTTAVKSVITRPGRRR